MASGTATADQLGMLRARFAVVGITEPAAQLAYCRAHTRRQVAGLDNLTHDQAGTILAALEARSRGEIHRGNYR